MDRARTCGCGSCESLEAADYSHASNGRHLCNTLFPAYIVVLGDRSSSKWRAQDYRWLRANASGAITNMLRRDHKEAIGISSKQNGSAQELDICFPTRGNGSASHGAPSRETVELETRESARPPPLLNLRKSETPSA